MMVCSAPRQHRKRCEPARRKNVARPFSPCVAFRRTNKKLSTKKMSALNSRPTSIDYPRVIGARDSLHVYEHGKREMSQAASHLAAAECCCWPGRVHSSRPFVIPVAFSSHLAALETRRKWKKEQDDIFIILCPVSFIHARCAADYTRAQNICGLH